MMERISILSGINTIYKQHLAAKVKVVVPVHVETWTQSFNRRIVRLLNPNSALGTHYSSMNKELEIDQEPYRALFCQFLLDMIVLSRK
nr:expressed protein [Hymenolepis microstoma]